MRQHGYLTGPALRLADIQIVYLLEVAERTRLLAGHPEIGAYLGRLKRHDALIRAVEVGGPMMPGA